MNNYGKRAEEIPSRAVGEESDENAGAGCRIMSVRPLTNEFGRLCRQLNSRCDAGQIRATKFCERTWAHVITGEKMPTLPGLRSGRVLLMVEAEERSADALN